MTTQCKTIAARTAQFCDMWISAARARSELSVAPKICRSHQPMGKSHVSRLTLRPKLETALNLIAFERRMSQVRHCHRNDGHRRRCHARLPRTWYTRCRYRRSARLGSVHGRLRDDGHPGCGRDLQPDHQLRDPLHSTCSSGGGRFRTLAVCTLHSTASRERRSAARAHGALRCTRVRLRAGQTMLVRQRALELPKKMRGKKGTSPPRL